MTESQLQTAVVTLARWLGYQHYHTTDSRRSRAGFPDLVLIHTTTGRLVFAELKSDTGRLSDAQRNWLRWLGICHEAHVWTPNDLTTGRVHAVLAPQPAGAPVPQVRGQLDLGSAS